MFACDIKVNITWQTYARTMWYRCPQLHMVNATSEQARFFRCIMCGESEVNSYIKNKEPEGRIYMKNECEKFVKYKDHFYIRKNYSTKRVPNEPDTKALELINSI